MALTIETDKTVYRATTAHATKVEFSDAIFLGQSRSSEVHHINAHGVPMGYILYSLDKGKVTTRYFLYA